MSVRADQRSESSLLFYKIARDLRREISCDLLNKFNSKNETFTTEENTVVNQKEQYPAYMVDFIRKDILGLLQKLMQYISIANSIYPACVLEVDKRRLLQDYAIGTAEALQNELEYCADVFPGTLRCLLHYADEVYNGPSLYLRISATATTTGMPTTIRLTIATTGFVSI